MKITGRNLVIQSVTGLVDLVNSQRKKPMLLASYIFADPKQAKFLSQHLSAHISCINEIPPQLLVGPAAPISATPSYTTRYNPEMFSVSCPQFISTPSPDLVLVSKILLSGHDAKSSDLLSKANEPLKPTKQKAGRDIGFFDRGMISGGLFAFLPVLIAVGTGVFIGCRHW